MSARTRPAHLDRYERYRTVIEQLVNRSRFLSGEIKRSCHEESPAFVTRILNELVEQGWLVRESPSADRFSWNEGRGVFSVSEWLDNKLRRNQIKESPEQERPRERLLAIGVANLRLSELLAILIRSGRPGESAVKAGEKLACEFDSKLSELPLAGRGELKSLSCAIDKTAFCQIMAGIELGRRVAAVAANRAPAKIVSSADAVRYCSCNFQRLIHDGRQEEFHIVTLDTKNQVIASHQITVGTLDASLVHPREVFRAAIKDAASSVLLVHNHPSGDPTPSREDINVTRRLESVGKLIGIDVLDHIILGNPQSVSLRELES